MLSSLSFLGLFSSRSAEIIVDIPPQPFTLQGELNSDKGRKCYLGSELEFGSLIQREGLQ